MLSVSSSAACAADVRIGAGAEALRQFVANLHLDGRRVVLERLQIGVGDDELDAAEAGLHHAIDGVAAAAADADHLDARAGAASSSSVRRKLVLRSMAKFGHVLLM